ncbi:hypothetical protein ACFL00_01460 [Pseudomonadota bacterium]
MKAHSVVLFSTFLLNFLWVSTVIADEDFIDFSDKTTATCVVKGLTAKPPPGWFNVPIESEDDALTGCQMMRTGREEELLGILRVLSVQLEQDEDSPPWYAVMLALEQQILAQMGYTLGDVLWRKDNVPISGEGFENARALGLAASIEGNDVPQEAHFLVFEHGSQKFLITLLTPARDVDEGTYYQRNTDDFGVLIRTLNR